MTDDYTPTTEEVHAAYLRENDLAHPDDLENAHQEFVRWLAGVKAEVLRAALDGVILSSGDRGITVWDSREHYDNGLPRPLPIREWLDSKADRIEGEA